MWFPFYRVRKTLCDRGDTNIIYYKPTVTNALWIIINIIWNILNQVQFHMMRYPISSKKTRCYAKYIWTVAFAKLKSNNFLFNSSSTFQLVAVTPNATKRVSIGQPMSVIIEFSPIPFNMSLNKFFVYMPNPEITSIYPNNFIVTYVLLLHDQFF